jgi:uncharacterized protein with PIN domain
MLEENIVVLSRCPECEGEMKIEVKDGKIASSVPDGVVEFVGRGTTADAPQRPFARS